MKPNDGAANHNFVPPISEKRAGGQNVPECVKAGFCNYEIRKSLREMKEHPNGTPPDEKLTPM